MPKMASGTYWAVAKVNEVLESSFVYVGKIMCNDVTIGPAPPGHVAVCVLHEDHAAARFVPDPKLLGEK